jgi:zinc protease
MDALDYSRMNTSTNELTPRPTHEFTLDNGLKVIVREDHRKPEFCSSLVYGVGPSYEYPEEWGLSEALFHAAFEETGRKTASIQEMGGHVQFEFNEHMSLELQLPREHLETAFKLQFAIMAKELQDEDIRRALDRRILLSKRKSLAVGVHGYSPELKALIETGSGMYRPPEGITANLERLTVEQVKQWHKTWFGPNNAVLSIAGDITPDEVKGFAEEYFGGIARCDLPDRPVVRGPSAPGYRRITQHLETEHPLMQIVFNTPGVATTTDYQTVRALQVIGALVSDSAPAQLGQIARSMLSNAVRYLRGDTQLSFCFGFTDPDKAESTFWSFVEELKRTPLSQVDIEQVINTVSAERADVLDSVRAQSMIIAMLVNNKCPWQLIDLEVTQLKNVTPADIQQAAQIYLTRDRVSIGRIYPLAQKNADIQR